MYTRWVFVTYMWSCKFGLLSDVLQLKLRQCIAERERMANHCRNLEVVVTEWWYPNGPDQGVFSVSL